MADRPPLVRAYAAELDEALTAADVPDRDEVAREVLERLDAAIDALGPYPTEFEVAGVLRHFEAVEAVVERARPAGATDAPDDEAADTTAADDDEAADDEGGDSEAADDEAGDTTTAEGDDDDEAADDADDEAADEPVAVREVADEDKNGADVGARAALRPAALDTIEMLNLREPEVTPRWMTVTVSVAAVVVLGPLMAIPLAVIATGAGSWIAAVPVLVLVGTLLAVARWRRADEDRRTWLVAMVTGLVLLVATTLPAIAVLTRASDNTGWTGDVPSATVPAETVVPDDEPQQPPPAVDPNMPS